MNTLNYKQYTHKKCGTQMNRVALPNGKVKIECPKCKNILDKPIKAKTIKKKLEDVEKMEIILGLLRDYPEAINKDRVIEMLETNIKYYDKQFGYLRKPLQNNKPSIELIEKLDYSYQPLETANDRYLLEFKINQIIEVFSNEIKDLRREIKIIKGDAENFEDYEEDYN